jgi:cytochrome c oxidase subunit IV
MAHEQAHGHLHHRAGPVAKQESTFHVQKPGLYMRTLFALLGLMIATVVFAEFHFPDVNLGFFTLHGTMINNFVAMAIAVCKALLVLMFFMGLKYSTKLTKLWGIAGFVGFALLFLALGDYSTRIYEPTSRWSQDPGSSMRRSVPESRQEGDFKKFERTGRF